MTRQPCFNEMKFIAINQLEHKLERDKLLHINLIELTRFIIDQEKKITYKSIDLIGNELHFEFSPV